MTILSRDYRAVFSMPLYRTRPPFPPKGVPFTEQERRVLRHRYLCRGTLTLYKRGSVLLRVRATSGLTEDQVINDYWTPNFSPIPASSVIIGSYSFETRERQSLPQLAWSMGSTFYPIKPDPVYQKAWKWPWNIPQRTEICIHNDENHQDTPGSAGCIVTIPLTHEEAVQGFVGWTALTLKLKELNREGEAAIPLRVEYSQQEVPTLLNRPSMAAMRQPGEQPVRPERRS